MKAVAVNRTLAGDKRRAIHMIPQATPTVVAVVGAVGRPAAES